VLCRPTAEDCSLIFKAPLGFQLTACAHERPIKKNSKIEREDKANTEIYMDENADERDFLLKKRIYGISITCIGFSSM